MLLKMISPISAGYPRNGGFTILELLISMTLVALLLVLSFGGLRFGTRAWDAGNRHLDASTDVQLAQDFLRASIEQAYPALQDASTSGALAFQGSAEKLDFLAPLPRAFGAAAIARMSISTVASGDSKGMLLNWALDLPSASNVGAPHGESLLLSNVLSVNFSYFGPDRDGRNAGWHRDWSERNRLPLLVRVSVLFQAGEERKWPDLIAAPAIHADGECIYDPVSQKCLGRA